MFQEFRLEPIINAKMPSLRWLCYGSAVDAAEMLKRGYTRETDIRRDRAGRWYQGDELITHDNLVRSFASWIDRAPDGRFCLRNDIHWVYATIEGPPYFVRSASLDGERLVLKLSGDRQEALDTGTLRVGPDDAVWCDVLQGRVPARFDNHAITQLAEVVGEDAQGLFLQIGAEVVRPPRVADPMAGWDPSKGHVES